METQQNENKTNAILSGSIWKQLMIFGFPLLLGNLFQQLYGSVDSVIVGRYVSSEALGAIGSTASLVFLVVSFLQGVATGATVVISQLIGQKNHEDVSRSMSSALIVGIIGGVVMAGIAILLTPYLLQWMLTPEEIFELSSRYLRIYYLSLPAVAIYNIGTAILRAMGDSRRPLFF